MAIINSTSQCLTSVFSSTSSHLYQPSAPAQLITTLFLKRSARQDHLAVSQFTSILIVTEITKSVPALPVSGGHFNVGRIKTSLSSKNCGPQLTTTPTILHGLLALEDFSVLITTIDLEQKYFDESHWIGGLSIKQSRFVNMILLV